MTDDNDGYGNLDKSDAQVILRLFLTFLPPGNWQLSPVGPFLPPPARKKGLPGNDKFYNIYYSAFSGTTIYCRKIPFPGSPLRLGTIHKLFLDSSLAALSYCPSFRFLILIFAAIWTGGYPFTIAILNPSIRIFVSIASLISSNGNLWETSSPTGKPIAAASLSISIACSQSLAW